jgi:hypothetical protein
VALYTTGLPGEVKDSRRSEVDSDLWEQRHDAAAIDEPAVTTAGEVLYRLVAGVAADISWRARANPQAPPEGNITMKDTLRNRIAFGGALLVIAVPILAGARTVVDVGLTGSLADGEDAATLGWGLLSVLAGSLMLTGLLLSRSSPRTGLRLLVVGVIGLTLFWYWMFIVVVPVGLGLLAIGYFRARRSGWPHGAAAA